MSMTDRNQPQQPVTIRGIRHIAAYLGVSHHIVRDAVRDGSLPRLAGTGRDTVVLTEDATEWLLSLRTTAKSA